MGERYFIITPLNTVRTENFQEALAKAKRFAKTHDDGYVVLEAVCIAHPDGMTEILEKPKPAEGDDAL
jgi:hypothetical protein